MDGSCGSGWSGRRSRSGVPAAAAGAAETVPPVSSDAAAPDAAGPVSDSGAPLDASTACQPTAPPGPRAAFTVPTAVDAERDLFVVGLAGPLPTCPLQLNDQPLVHPPNSATPFLLLESDAPVGCSLGPPASDSERLLIVEDADDASAIAWHVDLAGPPPYEPQRVLDETLTFDSILGFVWAPLPPP